MGSTVRGGTWGRTAGRPRAVPGASTWRRLAGFACPQRFYDAMESRIVTPQGAHVRVC